MKQLNYQLWLRLINDSWIVMPLAYEYYDRTLEFIEWNKDRGLNHEFIDIDGIIHCSVNPQYISEITAQAQEPPFVLRADGSCNNYPDGKANWEITATIHYPDGLQKIGANFSEYSFLSEQLVAALDYANQYTCVITEEGVAEINGAAMIGFQIQAKLKTL